MHFALFEIQRNVCIFRVVGYRTLSSMSRLACGRELKNCVGLFPKNVSYYTGIGVLLHRLLSSSAGVGPQPE